MTQAILFLLLFASLDGAGPLRTDKVVAGWGIPAVIEKDVAGYGGGGYDGAKAKSFGIGFDRDGAQPSPSLYEPILQHMQKEFSPRPLILYDSPLKVECLRGGCIEPWAPRFSNTWLEKAKSRQLIAEFCTYQQGLCTQSTGEHVHVTGAIYVTLTTEQRCKGGEIEVLVTLLMDGGVARTALKRYMLYRLIPAPDGWTLVSATKLADGYIDGE